MESVDHVVIRHGSLVKVGTKDECDATAFALNTDFQTDEYRVEKWVE